LELSHIFRRDTFGSLSCIYWYHPNTLHYIVTKQTLGSLEGTTMVCILPSTPRTYSSQGCSTTISRVAPLRSPAHDDILNNARGNNNSIMHTEWVALYENFSSTEQQTNTINIWGTALGVKAITLSNKTLELLVLQYYHMRMDFVLPPLGGPH